MFVKSIGYLIIILWTFTRDINAIENNESTTDKKFRRKLTNLDISTRTLAIVFYKCGYRK